MGFDNIANQDALRSYLRQMEKDGTKLYINGALSDSERVAYKCVNEHTVYMPDYVTDEHGKVREIRYDKIRHL